MQLLTNEDLTRLREIAHRPKAWKVLTKTIVERALHKAQKNRDIKRAKRKQRETDKAQAGPAEEGPPRSRRRMTDDSADEHRQLPPTTALPDDPLIVIQVDNALPRTDAPHQRTNHKRRIESVTQTKPDGPTAKRKRYRLEQMDNPGSVLRNNHRDSSANVHVSFQQCRDV